MHKIVDHSRKVKKAMRISTTGRYPGTVSAMLRAIPDSAIATLTACDLAALIDAMYDLAQSSKAVSNRETVEAGMVWDARRHRHLDVVA